MKDFKGKVAVVTGAASGIGLGIVKKCLQEEMNVIMADIDMKRLRRVEKKNETRGSIGSSYTRRCF